MARALLVLGFANPLRILCTREYQISIADSVHRLLSDQIYNLKLESFYEITKTEIRGKNGTVFIFRGMHHNASEIKSMEGIDIAWIEEGEKTSNDSLDLLIPTVRKPDSQIWITFNPFGKNDPVMERFVYNPPDGAIVEKVNHCDNPWFPDVLRQEMEYDKRTNHDRYMWVWEGNPRGISDAQVYKGRFEIAEIEAGEYDQLYFGADWGFAADPSTLIRCFVRDKILHIDHEAYGVGVDIDDTPALFRSVPKSDKWKIYADSARPETISYMQRNGFPMVKPVKKWSGSVEDGIEHIKGYEKIIIHPRCKHMIEEMELYQYKQDRITNEVLPILIDANNHCQDALRYALGDLITAKKIVFF